MSIPANKSAGKRAIRFSPDFNTIAWVRFQTAADDDLPEIVALVRNESFKGCSLILVSDRTINKDELTEVRVGKLSSLKGRVAWVRSLEDNIFRLGIEYFE